MAARIAATKTTSKGPRLWMRYICAVFLLGLLPFSQAKAEANGIFGYNTAGCTSCHSGTTSSNSGYSVRVYKNSVSVANQLVNTSDTLSKNVPVTFWVRLQGTGAARGGFNLGVSTGTFAAGGDTRVDGDANEATHTDANGGTTGGGKVAPGGDVEWQFTYNPPNSVVTATFNICGNPVDGDGNGNPDSDDGASVCSTYTAAIVNNAPVADNESTSVGENSTVNITDAVLLTGDNDVNGDSLSITGFTQPSGLAFVTDNGASFTYNPNGKYEFLDSSESLVDTFTYTVSDDGLATDIGTVSITVNGANDPPIANANTIIINNAGDTATTVVEGGSSSVLTNDTDVDSGEAVKQAFLVSGPSNHDVGMAGAFALGTDGTFSYTHDGSAAASDSFTYRVWDGTAFSGNATVSITVSNTAPTANDDLLVDTVDEGGIVNFTVLGNDFDPETSAIAVVNITNEVGGTATVEADQSITFDHDGSESPASFRYQANDGVLTSTGNALVTLTVNPVNDPPVVGSIADFSSDEGVPIALNPGVTDPDDTNGVDFTWSFVGAKPALMTINASTGVVDWTPPLGPPAVFNQFYDIVIQAHDGDVADTESFRITVNPPDGDMDLVADYDDFCVSTPSVNDLENFDNDLDGVAGANGDAGSPLGLANTGGDVCDDDDDNDGMPDDFEDDNSFDKFNAADASADADGDGVSNLDEYNNGTNPNLGNLTIDATGYLTPYDLVPPEPTSIHTQATAVTPVLAAPAVSSSATGPYRPGNNAIIWMPSNGSDDDLATNDPGNLVSDPPTQPFSIRPLASFGVNQQVEENSAVTVTVRLNGDSPSWVVTAPALPTDATVNYSVSGTANNPADHDAIAGVLNFAPGDYEEDISFTVFPDGLSDSNETVVFTLTGANNAAIGSNNTHTVTIVEENIAPRAQLQFRQDIDMVAPAEEVGSTYAGSGPITIDAMPSDANDSQTLSCDWSGTDNALTPPGIVADCETFPSWPVAVPVAGNYLVDVVVTDNGSPARSTRVSRILHVSAAAVVALGATDSDMDGTDDASEGFRDSDGDGIPDYLDDARVPGGNLIPDQTADPADSLLLETEPGLTLRRGSTTQAANLFGALVTDSAIAQFGSVRGDAPLNSADSLEHVGGIYDFEIDGLIPGSSARIVIPLQSAIPRGGRYRKFNPAIGWSDFVVDANNQIASASGELGACPEPGSSAYVIGLNYLDNCIQLTILDGGPNDTDNQVNGVINDPAAVGVTITDPEGFEEVEEGSGGRVSPLLLAVLLMLGGLAFWRRQRGV